MTEPRPSRVHPSGDSEVGSVVPPVSSPPHHAAAPAVEPDAASWTRRISDRWPGPTPSFVDVVVTACLGVVCLPFAAQVADAYGSFFMGVVGLVLVGMFTLPFLWRSSAPLTAAGVVVLAHLAQVLLLSTPSTANVTAPMIVYSVTRWSGDRSARRVMLVVAGVGSAVAAVDWTHTFWSSGWPTTLDVVGVVMIAGVCFATALSAWLLGALVRQRAVAADQVRERAAADERGRIQSIRLAAQEERARIAREMHDVVAHSLSVVVVQSDGAGYAVSTALARADDGEVDVPSLLSALRAADSVLATIGDTAREALTDTRRLVSVLRQDDQAEYAPSGGVDTLGDLVEPLRAAGLSITTDVTGRVRPLTRTADLACYRVVQESLTNIIKHAGEAAVWISLDYLDHALMLTVRDDGVGVTHAPDGQGHGLVGMRERIAAVGGRLHAGGVPGGGFVVEAWIPYDGHARDEDQGSSGGGAPQPKEDG